MAPGDRLYPRIYDRPLYVAIRGSTGWWNWLASKYESAAKPLDPKRYAFAMYLDPVMPRLWSLIIPAAARVDPACLVVECTLTPATGVPAALVPTGEVFWVGLAAL